VGTVACHAECVVEQPKGTVTFLFTDIEGSTRLWEDHTEAMEAALQQHDEAMRAAIERFDGYVFSTAGDAFAVAFARSLDAVSAARSAQEALRAAAWPEGAELKVRMGLHTGEAQERDGDYFGPAVNRAARIMGAGHGGQVLISSATAELTKTDHLLELGEYRLKDLSATEHLYQLGDAPFPFLRTLDVVQHNLPVERTPLVGRQIEVGKVADLVGEHRLVTLLGMGGTGKTRLATAVAAELADRFSDGVWFVDLVPVSGAGQVVEAIATGAGLSVSSSDAVIALAELIARREMLLILDNCEHITDDVAEVVDVLLEETITPTFLATSREPLQLIDERQTHVDPLAVVDGISSPANELFALAAQRVGAQLTPEQSTTISRICTQLDGLPLSIELAAAQLRHLTLAELAERLDERFEILTRAPRGRRRRQASLQVVLEDTWNMLDDNEQGMLLLLAAFPAGFTVGDVEEVADTAIPGPAASTFAGLVDRSLVASGGDGHHRLLETVKLFARERWIPVSEPSNPVHRHRAWVESHLTARPEADRYTSLALVAWAHQHYEDHRLVEDNIAASGLTQDLIDLLHSLIWAYQVEAASRAAPLLDRIETYVREHSLTDHDRGRLRLVQAAASLAARRPDVMVTASREATELLSATGANHELAWALIHNSWMKVFSQPDDAIEDLNEATSLTDSTELSPLADVALSYRANHLLLARRTAEAEADFRTLDRRTTDRQFDYGRLMYLSLLAVHRLTTDPKRAWECRQEASAQNMELFGRPLITWSDLILDAAVAAANADAQTTKRLVLETQHHVRKVDNDNGLPDLLLPLATLAFALDDVERARTYLAAIRYAPRPTGWFPITIGYRQLRDQIGLPDTNPLDDTSIDDFFQEATAWMVSV